LSRYFGGGAGVSCRGGVRVSAGELAVGVPDVVVAAALVAFVFDVSCGWRAIADTFVSPGSSIP
jgi:hypothetical protein